MRVDFPFENEPFITQVLPPGDNLNTGAFVKTWQFDVNQEILPAGTPLARAQNILFAVKSSLVGFDDAPPTVVGSSDAATAGMDGVDRWVDAGDLIWGVGNHSWVVFQQDGVSPGFQYCIDLNTATEENLSLITSPAAGFTGGTIGARPTATDEVVVRNNFSYGISGSSFTGYVHVMQSTDGAGTRIVICRSGVATGIIVIDAPLSPRVGWPVPYYAFQFGTAFGSEQPTIGNFGSNALVGRSRADAVTILGLSMHTARGGSQLPIVVNIPNIIDGLWDLYPVGLFSTTAGFVGRHAIAFDFWFGSVTRVTGDHYPGDGSKIFGQFGDVVLPWNGETILTGGAAGADFGAAVERYVPAEL